MTRRNRAQGTSLVEILIATLLFFVVVVGLLPLFIRSIRNNEMGSESMAVSNYARTGVEDMHGLPFDHPDLTINAGTSSVLPWQYFHPGFTSGGRAPELDTWNVTEAGSTWRRRATVRQFAFMTPEIPENASADPNTTNLRAFEVLVETPRTGGAFGRGRQVRYVLYKAF